MAHPIPTQRLKKAWYADRGVIRERAERWRQDLEEVGGLSTPSKLPCRSWSTPAKRCLVGSLLAKGQGTICSKCYARKGRYVLPNVEAAMERRFKRLQAALKSPSSMRRLEEAFVFLMDMRLARSLVLFDRTGRWGRDDGRFFRWHDSGDLHGVDHLLLLNRIALRCAGTSFWLPTKEVGTVNAALADGVRFASNLVIRLSLPLVDHVGIPPSYEAASLLSPQVVVANAHRDKPQRGFEQCNAIYTDHSCKECRRCWDRDATVSYTVI